MPGLKIAIQLASLHQPFKKALITAAQLGASAVEIDARGEINPQTISSTGIRDLRRLLTDHELRVSAVGFQTRRGYDQHDDIERRVAATKAVMKFAHAVGSPIVVNQIGMLSHEETSPNRKLLIDVLTDLSLYGHQVGARLCAQTGTESGEDLKRFLDLLPQHGIGIDLDPGRLIVGGFSPLEAVQALQENILHVHATDGVQDRARGRGMETQLGRGTADYPALAGELEQARYTGYFTIARENSENPTQEIAAGLKYLKNL